MNNQVLLNYEMSSEESKCNAILYASLFAVQFAVSKYPVVELLDLYVLKPYFSIINLAFQFEEYYCISSVCKRIVPDQRSVNIPAERLTGGGCDYFFSANKNCA